MLSSDLIPSYLILGLVQREHVYFIAISSRHALEDAKADLLTVRWGIFNAICDVIKLWFNAVSLGLACRGHLVNGTVSSIKLSCLMDRWRENILYSVTQALCLCLFLYVGLILYRSADDLIVYSLLCFMVFTYNLYINSLICISRSSPKNANIWSVDEQFDLLLSVLCSPFILTISHVKHN